jgi:hypothetical protein
MAWAATTRSTARGGINHLIGGAGSDALHGLARDLLRRLLDGGRGVLANMLKPSDNTGDAVGDSYDSIFGLTARSFNDVLRIRQWRRRHLRRCRQRHALRWCRQRHSVRRRWHDHLIAAPARHVGRRGGMSFADYSTAKSGVRPTC